MHFASLATSIVLVIVNKSKLCLPLNTLFAVFVMNTLESFDSYISASFTVNSQFDDFCLSFVRNWSIVLFFICFRPFKFVLFRMEVIAESCLGVISTQI